MVNPTAPAPTASRDDQRVTQARVIRSEWTKLRTLPSSAWSLLVAAVLIFRFAGSTLATLPLLIVFFTFQRQLMAGIMSGAFKGAA